MDHDTAIRIQAAERYVLEEFPPEERAEFEEHFFECQECAEEVRSATIFAANATQALKEERAKQSATWERSAGRPSRRFWWTLATSAALNLALLAGIGLERFGDRQRRGSHPAAVLFDGRGCGGVARRPVTGPASGWSTVFRRTIRPDAGSAVPKLRVSNSGCQGLRAGCRNRSRRRLANPPNCSFQCRLCRSNPGNMSWWCSANSRRTPRKLDAEPSRFHVRIDHRGNRQENDKAPRLHVPRQGVGRSLPLHEKRRGLWFGVHSGLPWPSSL